MGAFTAQLLNFLRKLPAPDLTLVVSFFVPVLESAMPLYIASSKLLAPGALVLAGEQLLLPILTVAVLDAIVGQVGSFLVAK